MSKINAIKWLKQFYPSKSQQEVQLSIYDAGELKHTFTQEDIDAIKQEYRSDLLMARCEDVFDIVKMIALIICQSVIATVVLSIIIYWYFIYKINEGIGEEVVIATAVTSSVIPFIAIMTLIVFSMIRYIKHLNNLAAE